MQTIFDWKLCLRNPTPVLLPGKSHGRMSLEGCSPWGRWGSDTTERLHFHFSLSCIGEGNGNPLQCSCLENPRDGKPGGLPSYWVAQSWTRLKRLSSSSSSLLKETIFDLRPETWEELGKLFREWGTPQVQKSKVSKVGRNIGSLRNKSIQV